MNNLNKWLSYILYISFIGQGALYYFGGNKRYLVGAVVVGIAILISHWLESRKEDNPEVKEMGYVTAKLVRSKMRGRIVPTKERNILEQEIHPTNLRVLTEHQLILTLHNIVNRGERPIPLEELVELEDLLKIYKEQLGIDKDTLDKVKSDIEEEYGIYDKKHILYEYKFYKGEYDDE